MRINRKNAAWTVDENLTRRAVLVASACLPATIGACVASGPQRMPRDRLASLEAQAGGRLGVCMIDFRSGEFDGYRQDERFGLCSTFKLPLAAVVLREHDAGNLDLERHITFGEDDMVPYAPVVEQHLDEGSMTVSALAEAAQTTSDNVAANLLLRELGGPDVLTRHLRDIGDTETRLDRYEPMLNLVPPGEVRDTTTPRAMATTVRRFLSGSVLSDTSRALLRDWMINTQTGSRRLRAGFPDTWLAGNKTGTGIAKGMANKYNDVAVVWGGDPQRGRSSVWPAGRWQGFALAAYYEADGSYEGIRPQDEDVLRRVGVIAADWASRS